MFLVSQPTGLKFCLLPVFPSCLPIFGSVPVLIRSLSNYKLITFIVSTCQPLVICPIFVPVLWVLVCWLLLMLPCVCACMHACARARWTPPSWVLLNTLFLLIFVFVWLLCVQSTETGTPSLTVTFEWVTGTWAQLLNCQIAIWKNWVFF